MQTRIQELIRELDAYDQERRQSFPRGDCRKITEGDNDRGLDLVGDLNTYDMTITGPISWREKIRLILVELLTRLNKSTGAS